MKNRTHSLLLLIFLSVFSVSNLKAQCDIPAPFDGNTGVNMTIMLLPPFVQSLPVAGPSAYIVAKAQSGMVIGSSDVNGTDQTSLTLWGNDTFTDDIDGALTGESISFELVDGANLYAITPLFGMGNNLFVVNGIASAIGSTNTLICTADNSTDTVLGCVDDTAINFDTEATEDDGSCEYSVPGCVDVAACNFDANATQDDNSCVFPQGNYDCNGVCLNDIGFVMNLRYRVVLILWL